MKDYSSFMHAYAVIALVVLISVGQYYVMGPMDFSLIQ